MIFSIPGQRLFYYTYFSKYIQDAEKIYSAVRHLLGYILFKSNLELLSNDYRKKMWQRTEILEKQPATRIIGVFLETVGKRTRIRCSEIYKNENLISGVSSPLSLWKID